MLPFDLCSFFSGSAAVHFQITGKHRDQRLCAWDLQHKIIHLFVGEVEDGHKALFAAAALKGIDTFLLLVTVQPLEAAFLIVLLPE